MRHDFRRLTMGVFGGLILLGGLVPASAQTSLADLSIEDLLNTEITSVSRKEQTLSRTAAAVHVITSEDIRRSGSTTLADILRMAPGFMVGQLDATSWAVSARGFNGYIANKLLVMIDGRSVYSPMFSGVHWEMQNLPLSEIDRIEVVRGPGGTLWGVNAVNGVVNIITKRADATQGGELTAGMGSAQRGLTEARYGGRAGDRGYYRIFGRYSNTGTGGTLDGFSRPDDAHVTLGGGRFDWRGEIDTVSVSGVLQDGDGTHVGSQLTLTAPFTQDVLTSALFTEGNILFSWNRSISSGAERGVQAFVQNYTRSDSDLVERWRIADVEARQRQTLGRHEIVFGAGFRATLANGDNGHIIAFTNPVEHKNLVTAFVQDEVEIGHDIRITPGAKFERNGRTGFEWQPSIRGTWTPTRGQSIWAAVSRAVRTPSKIDRDVFVAIEVLPIPGPLPSLLAIEGSPDYRSEDVKAVEAGYRWQRGIGSVDIAAFVNSYDDLKQSVTGSPHVGEFQQRQVLFIPIRSVNAVEAETRGVEIAGALRPAEWWRIVGSYGLMNVEMGHIAASEEPSAEGPVPNHQFQLRTYLDLPARTEISAALYGASAIEQIEVKRSQRLDLRLAWRVIPRIELSVTAQNLFHDNVIEYSDRGGRKSVPVRTAVFGGAAFRF